MADDPKPTEVKKPVLTQNPQEGQAQKPMSTVNVNAPGKVVVQPGELGSAATRQPTPTQEETDLAKLGVSVHEHEPDGSPQQDPLGDMRRRDEDKRRAMSAEDANKYKTK